MSPRLIRLRRPATLSVQEGVFVPRGDRGLLAEVDRRWAELCRKNPAYFDGRLFHVLGVHRNGHGGAVLHVIDCAYRFFAVQDHDFDLGLRTLGVKAITKRDDMILMGLRSSIVACYQNMWEFAPGGSVSPDIQPAALIQQELQEETGLSAAREPTSLAVIFDPVLKCWELVFGMEVNSSEFKARPEEYTALEWRKKENLPPNLSPIAQQMVALLE
jgi:8-oxo-dGTP pyrophosphatase MutT (NUDIX family)